MQKVLHNSKDVPLQITIGNMLQCNEEVEQTLMELLWPHRARWGSSEMLGIRGDVLYPWRNGVQLNKAMPALRSLGLQLAMTTGPEEFLALFAEAPALEKLSLRGFPKKDFDVAKNQTLGTQWENVRTLALTLPGTPSADLPVLFTQTTNVTVLYLGMLRLYLVEEQVTITATSYSFPKLEAFMLADTHSIDEPYQVLPQVNAPLLRVLTLDRTFETPNAGVRGVGTSATGPALEQLRAVASRLCSTVDVDIGCKDGSKLLSLISGSRSGRFSSLTPRERTSRVLDQVFVEEQAKSEDEGYMRLRQSLPPTTIIIEPDGSHHRLPSPRDSGQCLPIHASSVTGIILYAADPLAAFARLPSLEMCSSVQLSVMVGYNAERSDTTPEASRLIRIPHEQAT